jgi:large subunit ribosomal protein L21
MNAVVEIAGKQFTVTEKQKLIVPTLPKKAGDKLSFDRVLLVSTDKGTQVGAPVVSGAKVEATVVGHTRGEKVIVFKKKRRKGYRVTRGHRQKYTEIEITKIGA